MSTAQSHSPVARPAAYPAPVAAPAPAELDRVYVWQLPIRLIHWTIFFSIAVLAVTGFYIGKPFGSVPGEARLHFVMGTVKVVHLYAAIAFTLAILSRVVMLFVGNEYARWPQMVPVERQRRKDMWGTALFYAFIRRDPPPVVGHNPLAGFFYLGVYGLLAFMSLSGLVLYAPYTHVHSPLRAFAVFMPILGGLQTVRLLHHIAMWLILGFTIHHVYSGILMTVNEKTGTMESIFSGWKFIPRSMK